ncbi:MAG: DUF799 family lipoprotein [Phycisphaeraceae bacterium]|nr:DUF799 family lipoprotein [Phycisphaeraceae bacterium]
MNYYFPRWVGLVVLLGVLGGCVSPKRPDYRSFLAHQPKSILVLPPINNSANVHASDAFLSSVTTPLADCGYYVFPVAVVDRLFKDNGVPTPGDMHSVSLKKIDEIIGPDAVLYITIKEWTTTYILIDSSTKVTLAYKLVDVKTAQVLWQWEGGAVYSSSAGQSDPIAAVLAAGIHAVGAAASEGKYERDVAVTANFTTFNNLNHGLLRGARSPQYVTDQERIKALIAKEDAKAKTPAQESVKPGEE